MTRGGGKNRDQIEFTSLDELVPEEQIKVANHRIADLEAVKPA